MTQQKLKSNKNQQQQKEQQHPDTDCIMLW